VREKAPFIFIIVMVLGIVTWLAIDFANAKRQSPGPFIPPDMPRAVDGIVRGPQDISPTADRLDDTVTPLRVMLAVASKPNPAQQRIEAQNFTQRWVSDMGWTGLLVSISDEDPIRPDEPVVLKLYFENAVIPTGGFVVIATTHADARAFEGKPLAVGDTITIGGYVENVSVTNAGGASDYRIDIGNAYVQSHVPR
jgi:hypothetical protein